MAEIRILHGIEGARAARGAVVLIDVLRAFTTAAYAFDAGLSGIELVATVEQARARPGFRMGEVGGRLIPGFDHDNSPHGLAGRRLRGTGVQRTGAGTQCVVAATGADSLWLGSLVVAGATARALAGCPLVSLVATREGPDRIGQEDLAGALYLEALLRGRTPPAEELVRMVLDSADAAEHLRGEPGRPIEDLACCTSIDRFDFAMRVDREVDRLVARVHRV